MGVDVVGLFRICEIFVGGDFVFSDMIFGGVNNLSVGG